MDVRTLTAEGNILPMQEEMFEGSKIPGGKCPYSPLFYSNYSTQPCTDLLVIIIIYL